LNGRDAGELTHEALQLMSDESSMSDYYDLTMNPLLLQLVIAASSLFILIVIVTFCCCIEIRRSSDGRLLAELSSVRLSDSSFDISRAMSRILMTLSAQSVTL